MSIWNSEKEEEIKKILNCIEYMKHPVAELKVESNVPVQAVTPTSLICGAELPIIMSFPRKSVSGVAVVDMAEL